MKEFINSLTGTRMQVADEREGEYLAAGHLPAVSRRLQNDVAIDAADHTEKRTQAAAKTAKADAAPAKKGSAGSKRGQAAKR